MESKRQPRVVVVIMVVFLTVSAIFAAAAPVLHYNIDWAGVTMIGALSIAMALLAYVLIIGSADE
jgi:hypothetical protein